MIAGRLPGRTANDVKNFWSTRLRRKIIHDLENTGHKCQEIVKPIIVRPKPFSNTSFCLRIADHIQSEKNISRVIPTSAAPPIQQETDWLKAFLEEEDSCKTTTSSSLTGEGLIAVHIQSEKNISCRALPTSPAVGNELDWWRTFLSDEEDGIY